MFRHKKKSIFFFVIQKHREIQKLDRDKTAALLSHGEFCIRTNSPIEFDQKDCKCFRCGKQYLDHVVGGPFNSQAMCPDVQQQSRSINVN